jgi:predicted HicB family RNase H-like nuclease
MCAKIGKEPQLPYSGTLYLRIAPAVHLRAALAAEAAGNSLDQWVEEVFDKAATRRDSLCPAIEAWIADRLRRPK